MKTLLLALLCSVPASAVDDKPIEVTKQVEPDWGALTSGYLVEQREVQLEVGEKGVPLSFTAKGAIPDPVVRALAQWRFKTGNILGPLQVSVRIPITPELERAQSPKWYPNAPLREAIKRAGDLDAAGAAQLLANLPNAEEPGNPRTTLLAYYAQHGATDPETARKARRDLIIWLIRIYPQDHILSSPYSIVDATGEPLADNEGSGMIQQEWLKAAKEYPYDDEVIRGAANALRLSDPKVALNIVAGHKSEHQADVLGSVAASTALGVNTVDPVTGATLAVATNDFIAPFRKALLSSPDLKVVLSAMASTGNMGRDLAAHNALPADYAGYCGDLLKHTRELFPQTSLTCDTTSLASNATIGTQRIGGRVAESNLLKRVQPVYPTAAKDERIQGKVEFTAVIGPDGRVQRLQLVRGPLALYVASYDAVMQWEYRPVLLNGKPLTVITDIIVNFTLSQ